MKITASMIKREAGSDGCFVLRDAYNFIIGYQNISEAQDLADSINIQIAAEELADNAWREHLKEAGE